MNESFVFPRLLLQKYIYCNNSLFPILETNSNSAGRSFCSCGQLRVMKSRGKRWQTASTETKFSDVQNFGAEMGENKGSLPVQQGQLQAEHNGSRSSDIFIFSCLAKILNEPATLFKNCYSISYLKLESLLKNIH